MTFYDVKHRQYQDYMNDVEKVKPYRGKVAKAYPLGNRKYSARHFTVGEDGVVSVWNSSFTYLEDTREGETQPRRETAMPHAYVYPDNTIEILKSWDVAMLSKVVGHHVCHSLKYGGTIVRDSEYRLHPLFKGARISLTNGKVVTPYEWHNQDSRIKPIQVAATLNCNAGGREGHLVQSIGFTQCDAARDVGQNIMLLNLDLMRMVNIK